MFFTFLRKIVSVIIVLIKCLFPATIIEPTHKVGRVLEEGYYKPTNYSFADFSSIQNTQVPKIDKINEAFNKDLVIGVYGEQRGLYTTQNNDLHLGIDLFVKPGTKVVAPFDLEVFGVYHSKTLNGGVGGVVTSRVSTIELTKKGFEVPSQLIDQEYFYIQFLHLTKDTLLLYDSEENIDGFYSTSGILQFERAKNIDINNTRKIKAGEIIGKVGARFENGGWPEHLHLQYITSLNEFTRIPSRPWMVGAAKKLDNTFDPTIYMGIEPGPNNKLKFTCQQEESEFVCRVI